MVIYWFGFISDLCIPSSKEGIFIKDTFPKDEDIILMNPCHDILSELQSDEIISQVNAKQFDTTNEECLSFGNEEALK